MRVSKPSKNLIGKIAIGALPYYDLRTKQTKFKKRPMLIIGVEKDLLPCDLTYLPLSSISIRKNVSDKFDVMLKEEVHAHLNLNIYPSYIRTHKQGVIYSKKLSNNFICDLLEKDIDLFERIKLVHQSHHKTLY